MATKVIIPTSYGSPSATFWINDQKYVLPTGVEVTAPDEVALLISQHEAQEKREEPQYLPDVVDVVLTFDAFSATNKFLGTSNKTLEDIYRELGNRGLECLNLRIKGPNTVSMPFRIEKTDTLLVACWTGLNNENGIRVYKVTMAFPTGLKVTGEPMLSISGSAALS